MKKLYVTALTILTCGAAYALPIGNPADASLLCDGLILEGHCGDPCDPYLTWCDAFSVRLGFYGDYIFNRHLQIDTHESDAVLEHSRFITNAGLVVANFWDRFDLFATLGISRFCIDTNVSAFSPVLNGPRLEIESSSHFSWSLGLRGTIWECGCTTLGAEGQYFFTHTDIRRVTLSSLLSVYPDNIDAKYREWQIGLGIAHRINVFVPYVAVKWSRSKLGFDNAVPFDGVTLNNVESEKDWGFAVGISLVDCEKTSLTVEGRWSDERALHVNGQIRF